MEVRFMTGEMAQLHGISKQTLIYYDRIGLLSPRIVDSDTRYRYYDLDQFEDLELILILKNLGMKLNEIKAYRDKATIDARLSLLESRNHTIHLKIEEFKRMQKRLEVIIRNAKDRLAIKPFSKGIKWLEDLPLVSVDVPPPYDLYRMELSFKEIFRYASKSSEIGFHDFLVVVEDAPDGAELFKKIAIPAGDDSNDLFAGGYYAFIHHQGSFEAMKQTRNQLQAFIKKSGYNIAGPFIEQVLLSGLEFADEKEYLVEVRAPVTHT